MFLPRFSTSKRGWAISSLLCLLMFSCYPVLANDMDKARQYYQANEYKKAGKLWKKIGKRRGDNGAAHFQLAELYKNGFGYEQDFIEASKWYRQSADKNYVLAMHALGALYYRDGDKSVRSVRGAILWWEKAARAGHKASLLELANLYMDSDERDILAAKRYGRLAALAGEPAGLFVVKRVEEEIIAMNILGARRLANIQPDKYTIELASFLSFNQAWRFVISNQVKNARIHRNIYSDFVVTIGVFNSSDGAFTRISQLPSSLIELRPRPRELRVIQRELIQSKGTFAEMWLYKRPPNKYTVTLYSAEARLDALDYVDEHGLEDAAIYHSKLGQWVVNAGIFNQAQEATAAISQLPQKMKAHGPVANSFQAIQGDMMRSRSEIEQMHARFATPKKTPAPIQPKPVQAVAQQPTKASRSPNAPVAKSPKASSAASARQRKAAPVVNRTIRQGKWAFTSRAANKLSPESNPTKQTPQTRTTGSVAQELLAADVWLFNPRNKPYSLQLVTTSNAESIAALLRQKRQELGGSVHLFDQFNPRYFYLLYGDFSTPEAARSHASRKGLGDTVVISLENHKLKRCQRYEEDASKKADFQRFCQ